MLRLERIHLQDLEKKFPNLSMEDQVLLMGGGSTYTFDRTGRMTVTQNAYDHDVVYAGTGSFIPSRNLTYTTFDGEWDDDGNGILTSYSGIRFSGASRKLFEFLSENTDVEWGLSCNNDGRNPDGVMTTNYNESTVRPDTNLINPGYESLYHSHPHGNGPSPDDEEYYATLRNRKNQELYDYEYMFVYNPLNGSYIPVDPR